MISRSLSALLPLLLLPVLPAARALPAAQPLVERSQDASTDKPEAAVAFAVSPAAGLQLDLPPLLRSTGQPPLPASGQLAEDLAVLRWLQRNRTPQMVATTWTTLARDVSVFSPALGVDMVKTTPVLLRGMGAFLALVDQAGDAIKNQVRRPRPYWSHADLHPCLPPEQGFSFPSGHSSWYAAASLLLADLLPERRERLLELGQHGGANRVMCGVHYPSDVQAAQRFALAASAQIIASPQWQRFRRDPALEAELQSIRDAAPQALPLLVR